MMSMDEADKVEHLVEDQWHYPIMVKHGWMPITKVGIGFVRSYVYQRKEHQIRVTTGVSCDHWSDQTNKASGYWSDLEPHLVTLDKEVTP